MNQEDELDLGHYSAALRRRWWLVALTALAFVVVAVALVPAQTTRHESRSTVLVNPFSVSVIEGFSSDEPVNELTEIAIARSDAVIQGAIDTTQLDRTVEEVTQRTEVVSEEGSRVLEITYEGNSDTEALAMAEALAASYIEVKEVDATDDISTRIDFLDAEIQQADAQVRALFTARERTTAGTAGRILADARISAAQEKRAELVTRRDRVDTVQPDVGQALGHASEPELVTGGISPAMALFAALVAGGLAGLALALLLDRFDRRIRGDDTIEELLATRVVGRVPKIADETPELVTAMRAETAGADAYRRFAAAVIADTAVGSVLITSARGREARTVTAVNTAVALQQAGRRVYLVSADRRNPEIDRLFGMTDRPGLDQYFHGRPDRAEAEALLDAAAPRLGMRVVGSGTTPGAVPQPLSSSGVQVLLELAREQDALVVFDSPPVIEHADALSLAGVCDATFVVVDRDRTVRNDLEELRTELRAVRANVAGAVSVHTSRRRGRDSTGFDDWSFELVESRDDDDMVWSGVGESEPEPS